MMKFAAVCLFALALLLGGDLACAQATSLRPIIGGLPADSGLSLGVELLRKRLAGPVDLRLKAIGSVKRYQFLEGAFEVARLGAPWLFLELSGRYRDYPEEDFWGVGPDTLKGRRSNFRLKEVDSMAIVGAAFQSGFRAGVSGGFLQVSTGAGRDRQFPIVEKLFTSQEAPALDRALDYKRGGFFFEYDSLDESSDPRSGGNYAFRGTMFAVRGGDRFSFRRYEIDLRQFVAMPGEDRIGLRVYTVLTDPVSGHQVPFFMQPTAGGTDTVRGFHQYRFRDRNALVLNAEYRRALAGFLDAIAFADAGRVFSRPGEFAVNGLRAAGGLGVRVKFRRRVFFGVDVGISRDGARLWIRGDHMF
ncbi:MAG: BamA/TamA family outer membrane protein [Acidobacteria bacterium]|nr:BamA/TamA family outer membrane protein [Acidobacteriota bacterium]